MSLKDDYQDGHDKENHLSQLASVGQIAAGIAHEVRNPLTAVKGFLQLLQKEGKKEYIEIAQTELENALTTLNNLLQVSKPNLEDEEFQTFHLSVEVESVLNLFQDKVYDVEVITSFKDTETTILGKKNQFKKALFNLIKNAFESISEKGQIKIEHYAIDKDVIVTIEDSGVGIPKEKLSILGTPFFSTKSQGTGMGLTQVFSVVYQHGGKITVDSEENVGTKFTLKIPIMVEKKTREVRKLKLIYEENISMMNFIKKNQSKFEETLLDQAINVKDKIEEIHTIGNINLLDNAHKLVSFVIEEKEHELINFAKQEGVVWAKYSLTLAFKLEWLQAIRRTIWDFLYNYEVYGKSPVDRDTFFTQEKKINELIDQFLNYFFISYSKYKDEMIESQRNLVENLSVPIIPITRSISILPLIGYMDYNRLTTIEEKVLAVISASHIESLIIDLSGIADMEEDVIHYMIRIIDGISMMGCKTVITGIRPEVARSVVKLGLSFESKAETKGTLQIALHDYLGIKQKLEDGETKVES